MSTTSIRLVLAISAVASTAWMMPACSGETDGISGSATSASSSAGTGGSGGGSSSSMVSSSSGPMTVMCGAETCQGVSLGGFADVPACCPPTNPDVCGIDISLVASFLNLPPGCIELNRPGDLDPSCPAGSLDIMGMMIMLPGCCSGGVCGVLSDIAGFAPFGCVDTAGTFTDGGMPQACTGGTGGAGGSGGGAGGSGGGAGGTGSSAGGAGGAGGSGGGAGGAGGTGG